jgi:putative Holliday junction resolvase
VRPSSTLSASLVRVLALDYGSARCGCALSDPTGTLATPIDPIARPATRKGFARVVDLVRDRAAERVVVGLPLGLSGADTDQTREARAWADRLAAAVAVPVELYDERFTTAIAARESGSHSPRTSEDSRAAAVLLEDWLVRHAREVSG